MVCLHDLFPYLKIEDSSNGFLPRVGLSKAEGVASVSWTWKSLVGLGICFVGHRWEENFRNDDVDCFDLETCQNNN